MVLRALIRRLRGTGNSGQLGLDFSAAPRDAAELLGRLNALGLRGVRSVSLTRNRSVMVSASDGMLRVHRAFLGAPETVHHALVQFLMARRRAERLGWQRVLVSYPIGAEERRAPRSPERTHPDDEAIAARLTEWHATFNGERFAGELGAVVVRVSRRMRTRLGHYVPAQHGRPAEIAISRRHVRRHGLSDALGTLLHEMVHQWQDEQGHPLAHDRRFREMAKVVGIAGKAKRVVD